MRAHSEKVRRKVEQLLGQIKARRQDGSGVTRREFVQVSTLAGVSASMVGAATLAHPVRARADEDHDNGNSHAPNQLNEATIASLQAHMAAGELSSVELTTYYLKRIMAVDQSGPRLNSIIQVNPDALKIAAAMDVLRRKGTVLGPMHGIPVLLKDNIDTADKMQTTAGSFALFGQPATHDSTVAKNLRAGGAVILGKTNLSEWANFRSSFSSSGWSGRGAQCHNPYALDRNPCGSSSGSGAAASANLATVSIGTETDGSIVCPANANGVVGIKPTIGLVSRAGIVPISHTQDTAGPHARTVADAAILLSVIQSQSSDGRDAATGGVPLGWQGLHSRPNIPADYTQFLDKNGLKGAVLGVTRQGVDNASPPTAAAFDAALKIMQDAGATLVDLDAANFTFPSGDGEFLVLLYDFKNDLKAYFATRVGVPVAGGTLADAIAFNNDHASIEMPWFGQDIFITADALDTTNPDLVQAGFGMSYNQALAADQTAGRQGIDLALSKFGLDAIVTPTGSPAWTTDVINGDHFDFGTSSLAAIVGYPIINVPMGNSHGLPVGVSFMNTAFSEPKLIKLASGFEHAAQARIVPQFFDNIPTNENAPGGGSPLPDPPAKSKPRLT